MFYHNSCGNWGSDGVNSGAREGREGREEREDLKVCGHSIVSLY